MGKVGSAISSGVSKVVSVGKSIGSGIVSAGKAVLGGIGNVIGTGAQIISNAVEWVYEKIKGVGDTPSYKPEEATVEQTKTINQLIQKCVDSYGDEARGYEDVAKEILEAYMQDIQDSLEPFRDGKTIPEYVFKSLQQETKFLTKSLDNLYFDGISRAFSLNNNKLLDILELEAGTEKENKLQKMAIETLDKTHTVFVDKIKEFLEEQQELIVKELKELKENHIKEGQNIEKSFLEIQEKAKDNLDMTETIDKLTLTINKLQFIKL